VNLICALKGEWAISSPQRTPTIQ